MVVGNLLDLTFDGQSAITGRAEDAPEPRSYVLTEPRPGFLALMPWVEEADDPERLREVGRHLAARSGYPRENRYRVGVLHADLTLPPGEVPTPPPTEHERALGALLRGKPVCRRNTCSGPCSPWAAFSSSPFGASVDRAGEVPILPFALGNAPGVPHPHGGWPSG